MALTEWLESITFQTMPLRKRLSAKTPRPVCKVYSLTGSLVLQTSGTPWPKKEQVLVTMMEHEAQHTVARKLFLETFQIHSSQNHTE